METYKIMIVDDEADVREGIARHIDWASLGFEVIAEAENGMDALDKAEACEIDVVLTDIKMPFMDGLTMCERLNALYPALKNIILTGFDEFEFAKAAIKLNVVEYVLKPINVAELTQIMSRVHKQLDDDVAQRRDADALRLSYEQALPLMRNHLLHELLCGAAQGEEFRAQIQRFNISLAQAPYQVVAVFELEHGKAGAAAVSRELAPLSVKRVVQEYLEGHCLNETFISASSIIAMTAWEINDPISKLMRLANEICLRCRRVLEIPVTAGVGRCHETVNGIHPSFLEAKSALEYKVLAGSGQAIYIQDMERVREEAVAMDSVGEQQLLSVIKLGTYEQIRVQIDTMLKRAEGIGSWEYKAYLMGIFNAIFRIVQRYELNAVEAVVELMKSLLELPEDWNEREKMGDRLCNICSCMSEYINAMRVTAANSLVKEAKRYINENYHDSGLSVERVCQHLHVSQTYFSSVFKQETGTSYVQYLTEARLNHAAALLRETDDKTYMIAQKVGYEEPNYFSYVFKKYFGVSPTKCRK